MNIMNALSVKKNEYVHRNDPLQCVNICLTAACILCQLLLIDIFVIRILQVIATCTWSEMTFYRYFSGKMDDNAFFRVYFCHVCIINLS